MIVALAGGIGAAKLLLGMSRVLAPQDLFVIGNTGDDIVLHGLRICPDLDTILYTLTGRANPATGWGVAGDTIECLKALEDLGERAWFQLGDRDLALHIQRTEMLAGGLGLAEATQKIGSRLGLPCHLAPMSEGFHPTLVVTSRGPLHVQEYLVRERCQPRVEGFVYTDIESAKAPACVLESIAAAEAIVLCPSNPFISIGPILAVKEIRLALEAVSAPVVAITPIVSGAALKGPAAKMLLELGYEVSPVSVARLYRGVVTRFVLDRVDSSVAAEIEGLGMEVQLSDTVMNSLSDKIRLAREVLESL